MQFRGSAGDLTGMETNKLTEKELDGLRSAVAHLAGEVEGADDSTASILRPQLRAARRALAKLEARNAT